MTRFQAACATICFLGFMAVLGLSSYQSGRDKHELAMAKVKAGCTKE